MTNSSPELELTQGEARKALGQHFLFDPDILRRIAGLLGPLTGRNVLEVGPGPGGLTRAIIGQQPRHFLVVEKDPRFAQGLRSWPERTESTEFHVIEGDATEIDYASVFAQIGMSLPCLIANLPYNIGTPLLISWLHRSAAFGPMALMFQKEVAQRITATVNSDHYGRLAVLSQSVRRARIAMTLPPGAFRPPPKVASAVVVLEDAADLSPFADLAALETITASAFGQRRKMLRSSLKQAAQIANTMPEALLDAAGILATARAEEVDVAGFQRLASAWRKHKPA
jgi:16S rRNA (adenine1518-N6/adenine1519-N6)-dimethyltransferase